MSEDGGGDDNQSFLKVHTSSHLPARPSICTSTKVGRDPIMITSASPLPPFQQPLLLHLPDLLHSMCNNLPRHLKVLILFLPILLTPFLDLRTMPLIHRSQIHLSLVLPTPRSQNIRNKGPIPRKFEFNLIIHTIINQLLPSSLPPTNRYLRYQVAIFF